MSVTLQVLPAIVPQVLVMLKLCPTMGPPLSLQMQLTCHLVWELCSTAIKSINQSNLSLFAHLKLRNHMKLHIQITFECMSEEHVFFKLKPSSLREQLYFKLSNNQTTLKGCMYLLSEPYSCISIMELVHYLHQISIHFLHNQSKWWLPWFHRFKSH